jgi:hypothetical protein
MAEELPAEGVKSYDELQADLSGYEEQQRQVRCMAQGGRTHAARCRCCVLGMIVRI